MKKRLIGGMYHDKRGINCESWSGGGIDDDAFLANCERGYSFIHCCQDDRDQHTFHYVFQKEGSTLPLQKCWMCSHRLVTLGEAMDVRVAPELMDALQEETD